MGCVSSSLLTQDDDFTHIGNSTLGHHIVSLTSTTYGLLTLDRPPTPMTPPVPSPRFTLAVETPSPKPDVINSWELMAGLDSNPKHATCKRVKGGENVDPNVVNRRLFTPVKPDAEVKIGKCKCSLDDFQKLCPPNGENKVVLYTTSLRGVRKTFEECNSVRSALRVLGYAFCERDISMDRSFKEELKGLLLQVKEKGKGGSELMLPPRLFIKGRYVGAAEEVLGIHEEGGLMELLRGLPKVKVGTTCDGCGDARFLPCFRCNGSCKLVDDDTNVVTRCPDCNENGLVLCPICS